MFSDKYLQNNWLEWKWFSVIIVYICLEAFVCKADARSIIHKMPHDRLSCFYINIFNTIGSNGNDCQDHGDYKKGWSMCTTTTAFVHWSAWFVHKLNWTVEAATVKSNLNVELGFSTYLQEHWRRTVAWKSLKNDIVSRDLHWRRRAIKPHKTLTIHLSQNGHWRCTRSGQMCCPEIIHYQKHRFVAAKIWLPIPCFVVQRIMNAAETRALQTKQSVQTAKFPYVMIVRSVCKKKV